MTLLQVPFLYDFHEMINDPCNNTTGPNLESIYGSLKLEFFNLIPPPPPPQIICHHITYRSVLL